MKCSGSLRHWTGTGLSSMNQRAILLRSHSHIFDPFVKPGGFESACGQLSDCCRRIWPTQSAKALLCHRTIVGITSIRGCAQPCQDEECDEVALVKHVDMGIRSKVT